MDDSTVDIVKYNYVNSDIIKDTCTKQSIIKSNKYNINTEITLKNINNNSNYIETDFNLYYLTSKYFKYSCFINNNNSDIIILTDNNIISMSDKMYDVDVFQLSNVKEIYDYYDIEDYYYGIKYIYNNIKKIKHNKNKSEEIRLYDSNDKIIDILIIVSDKLHTFNILKTTLDKYIIQFINICREKIENNIIKVDKKLSKKINKLYRYITNESYITLDIRTKHNVYQWIYGNYVYNILDRYTELFNNPNSILFIPLDKNIYYNNKKYNNMTLIKYIISNTQYKSFMNNKRLIYHIDRLINIYNPINIKISTLHRELDLTDPYKHTYLEILFLSDIIINPIINPNNKHTICKIIIKYNEYIESIISKVYNSKLL